MQLENLTTEHTNRRTHVLVECPELIASVRVGVLEPLMPGNGKLYDVCFTRTIDIEAKDICWADILVTVRGCEEITRQIAASAKKVDRMVIYYLDDDLLHLPEESLCYKYFRDNHQGHTMTSILGMCDALWGVNPKIREQYLPMCGKKRWIWNRLPATIIEQKKPDKSDVVQILYAGSVDHEKNVRAILVPAVLNVCKRFGDRVHFTFVGVNPKIGKNPHITYQPFFEDYDSYRKFVQEGNFSVALAVVKEDSFYQHKYFNKFVEYTSIGSVGVYTDCDLYRQVIRDGENGLLCANTTQAWEEAIVRLIEDAQLRETCLENAQTLIQQEFGPDQVFMHLLRQLPELHSYRAPECKAKEIKLPYLRGLLLKDRIKNLFAEYKVLAVPIIIFKAVKKICKLIRKVISNVS